MNKYLRWGGLAAFLGIILVISAFWLFFADNLVKQIIEGQGTDIVGAKVELEEVDVTLFPMGLTLRRLQVTNPDEPMQNAFEIDKTVCSMDAMKLLFGKVIIDEMSLDGVRLNTPRKTSGAIPGQAVDRAAVAEKAKAEKFRMPSFNKIPDIQKILATEELESIKVIESIQADIEAKKESWRNKLAELPDKKQLDDYKRRLKKMESVKTGDLKSIWGGISEAAKIQQEMSRHLDIMEKAGIVLKKDLASLRKRKKEAEAAVKKDTRRLKEKYTLSPQGITNISRMLFGDEIAGYVETTIRWYERIKPFLAGEKEKKGDIELEKPVPGKGVDVRFTEETPLPDFLIRFLEVSHIETKFGTLKGTIRDLTTDQDILGVPLTFIFSQDKIKKIQSIKLDGAMDHIVPSQSRDTLNYLIQGYQVRETPLSVNEGQSIYLQEGLMDLHVQAKLTVDNIIVNLAADFTATRFLIEAKNNIGYQALDSMLSGISTFTLAADISGTLHDYDIRLTSDLDRILMDALGEHAQKQGKRFGRELESAINRKAGRSLNELQQNIGGLEAIERDLTGLTSMGRK